jgi:hypothetical protein
MNWKLNLSGKFPLIVIKTDLTDSKESTIAIPQPVERLSRQELIAKQPLLARRKSKNGRKNKKSPPTVTIVLPASPTRSSEFTPTLVNHIQLK